MPSGDVGCGMGPDGAETEPMRDLALLIAQLEGDPESLPWPQRRALVTEAMDDLAQAGRGVSLPELLMLLAGDPKWEVRVAVADALTLLSDDDFARVAAKLADDANGYVQAAVHRAMEWRRRGHEMAHRTNRGLMHIEDEYDSIEKRHGSAAAEKARRMADRLYDVLVGTAVHDMRNVLTPLKSDISAMQSQLRNGDLTTAVARRKLQRMAGQAGMLEQIIDDMRDYSRATPPQRVRGRLAEVVQNAHEVVIRALRSAGRDPAAVTVSIDVPETLTLDMSPHHLLRALVNVLKNAFESFATDPCLFGPGRINVTARPAAGDQITMVMSDNGMGLSPEDLAEVRRFVPGRTLKRYGTGYGLPIARRKVEDHSGSLAIDSVLGEGTVVTITLPANAEGEDE